MRCLALFLKQEESIPRSFYSLFWPALLARSHCCESESGANGRSFATIDCGHASDRGGTDSEHGMHACGGGAAAALCGDCERRESIIVGLENAVESVREFSCMAFRITIMKWILSPTSVTSGTRQTKPF